MPGGCLTQRGEVRLAWAAGNTNTALPAFLETARRIAGQTIPAPPVPGRLPPTEP